MAASSDSGSNVLLYTSTTSLASQTTFFLLYFGTEIFPVPKYKRKKSGLLARLKYYTVGSHYLLVRGVHLLLSVSDKRAKRTAVDTDRPTGQPEK